MVHYKTSSRQSQTKQKLTSRISTLNDMTYWQGQQEIVNVAGPCRIPQTFNERLRYYRKLSYSVLTTQDTVESGGFMYSSIVFVTTYSENQLEILQIKIRRLRNFTQNVWLPVFLVWGYDDPSENK